jgi:CxxC-x17-CxxC domain-containing protein
MFDVICSSCGKNTQVPFQPTSGRPVYCSDCFAQQPRRSSYR